MDATLPEYRFLQPGLKFPAQMAAWRQVLTLPADAPTYALEIAKFLATGALILVAAVILLMAG